MLENGLINFGKLSMIHDRIMSIVQFQSLRYNTTVEDDLINYAKNLRALKDSVVYKYSLLCESKNGGGEERLIDKWAKENK
jgi:hypothetical protein